jgi:hypothetical protein
VSRRTLAAVGMGLVAACAVAGIATLLVGARASPAVPRRAALPPPPKPALAVPAPRGLGDRRHAAVWTSVLRRTTARARPNGDARPVARLARRTPEGTANTVLVIDRAGDAHGHVWVRARLPVLPNFYIRNRLTRYRSPMYGPLAFGTSARSAQLTDWPAGGFIGIHGTDRPDLLPGRVSHGCIRMRNADILRLGRLMPVGTPVTVS